MISPHTEACECLARHFDPALIIPTDSGGWGSQDGVRLTLLWSERAAMTDHAWQAIAQAGLVSAWTHARTPAAAMDKALGKIEPPEVYPSRVEQVAGMAHERRMAAF